MMNVSTYETDERSLKPKRTSSSSSSSALLPQENVYFVIRTRKTKARRQRIFVHTIFNKLKIK